MNRGLIDSPETAHVEAYDRLRGEAASFMGALLETVASWETSVADDILAQTALRCRELADVHDRLAESLGGTFNDPVEAWGALRRYAGAAARDVCGGVAERLDAGTILSALSGLSDATLSDLEERADRLPGPTVVPLDRARFDPVPGDSGLLQVKKRWFRLRWSVRLALARAGNAFRRAPLSIPAPLRTVSLQDHARAHVRGTVRAALLAAESDVRDSLAPVLFRLQRSVAAWSRDVITLFDAMDRGAWHVPDGTFDHDVAVPEASLPEDPPLDEALPNLRTRLVAVTSALTREIRSAADDLTSMSATCSIRDDTGAALHSALQDGGTTLHWLPALVPGASTSARPVPSGAADRSRLAAELVAFRIDLADREDEIHRSAVNDVLVPLARSGRSIRDHLRWIEVDALQGIEDGKSADALQEVHVASHDRLERMVRELPQPERVENAIRSAAEAAATAIGDRIESLPTVLRLPIGQKGRVRIVSVSLRETAEEAFERDLPRRVLEAYAPLRRELVRVWNDCEHVLNVVDSAFATAAEELDGAGGDADPHAAARSLIVDGLRRASELLEDGYDSLRQPWAALADSIHEILQNDWSDLERAVHADDFLAKQWQGARTRLIRGVETASETAGAEWKKFSQRAAVFLRAARMRIAQIVRIGREAVGAAETSGIDQIRTLEAVAGSAEVFAGLPLIYRKLFTLDALSESTVAVNRKDDLVAVRAAFHRWQNGNGPGLLVVRAEPGSGATSFLNLAGRSLLSEARIVRVQLPDRLSDRTELARLLCEALGIDEVRGDSLTDLEKTIQGTQLETTLVLVDDLEHLLLQTPGGTRLLEDLFLFFARTDSNLFWCASIGDLAWRFLERTLPAATGLATAHALTPWNRDSVEELIMERHRRTGMPLMFEAPTDPPPLLKQRLRRARSPEQVQRLLRDEFFDSLARASGQNPALALFGWVRTGRFDDDGDTLTLPPFRNLSFSFLNRLDNDRAFVLRAFLTHHTLSPEELALIFRFSDDHAMANLETLLALGLIEPVVAGSPASYVEAGTRYRLRRLVMQPVRKYLAERHFVY